MEQFQESIARYHEVRLLRLSVLDVSTDAPRHQQALSISPGDPVTCDLLKLVLDDVATHISARKLPFPGLPPSTLANIDASVAALDREILAGVEPRILSVEEQEAEEERLRRGEAEGEGEGGEGVTMEGETMEGDSQSMDVSASMDMTIE